MGETLNEAPATQGSAHKTTTKEVVTDVAAKKAEGTPNETPADAITAKAEEAAETQEVLKPTLDATATKAEEVKIEEPAIAEASATGQATEASNEETTAAPDEVPIAAEKVVAEKIAEADAASKAEVTESAVSVAVADAAVAGKQGGCLSYCTATEAQTEIVVQN